jgi:hypothetical protein
VRREVVGDPGDRVERVAHRVGAAPFAHALAVDRGHAARRAEVQPLPGLDRVAEHRAFVPGVVGDELERVLAQLGVVGVAVVGQLERRHHRAHRLRHALVKERGVGRRQVLGHLHRDLELDQQPAVVGGAHAGRRAAHARLEHGPCLRVVHADEAAHLRAGERNLVADDGAELLRAQRDEGILDGVRLLAGPGRELCRQRREALAPLVRFEQPLRRLPEGRQAHPRPGWMCPHCGQARLPE